MKKPKLIYTKKEGKAFMAEYTFKKDARSLPSTFLANTLYFPETEEDTQTFSVEIETNINMGKENVGKAVIRDEFDTAKEATKWIEQKFKEFLKIV